MSTLLRTSERNLFKRCQWRWEREYIDQIRPRKKESMALWFGSGIHKALEAYYLGEDAVQAWEDWISSEETAYIDPTREYIPPDIEEAHEMGRAMIQEYIKFYKDDIIKPIAVEMPFHVDVSHAAWKTNPNRRTKEVSTYVGTIDLIYRDKRDNIWLMDHKTTRALGSANTQYLPLDDQAGAYLAFAELVLKDKGLIEEDEKIEGITYNYLVKRMPDTRPINEDGLACNEPKKVDFIRVLEPLTDINVDKMTLQELKLLAQRHNVKVFGQPSKTQPLPMFDRVQVFRGPVERQIQIRRVGIDLEAMSLVRSGILQAQKSPNKECSFCPFSTICRADDRGLDWRETAKLSFEKWDPYASYQ